MTRKTVDALYQQASRQGICVLNLFNLTAELFGCQVSDVFPGPAGIKPGDSFAYAQGTTPAQALESAMETLSRVNKTKRA